MEKFKVWLLKYLMREQIVTGNVNVVFKAMRNICETEFYEDNVFAVDCYLQDALKQSRHSQYDYDKCNNYLAKSDAS